MTKTTGPYRLEYGFLHCIGRTVYAAGTAATEEQARAWVAARSTPAPGNGVVPADDPIRWCPVRHCHMKRQKPWFAYRKIDVYGT
jgi:hypothetical protein